MLRPHRAPTSTIIRIHGETRDYYLITSKENLRGRWIAKRRIKITKEYEGGFLGATIKPDEARQ